MEQALQHIGGIDWALWSGPALAALRIVLILVVAWISIVVLQRVVRAVRVRVAGRLGGVDSARRAETLGRVYELFPRLAERRDQAAGTLSGGEQQMAAIGRALMARPRLLMLDEPSLGLAPVVVASIFADLAAINRAGVTILLVEQNVLRALRLSHRAYVLENGGITLAGASTDLLADERVRRAYLGR